MSARPALCPSARCEADALLLGVVQADGRIGYLGAPLAVDQMFVDRAREGRSPERRFRFATPCVEGACRQWTGTRCGVIDAAIEDLATHVGEDIPACGLRAQCRWHRQSGLAACHACPFIVTETRAEGDDGGYEAFDVIRPMDAPGAMRR